jgi:hypothetical protein
MNRKQRACAVAAFLLLAAVAFGQQQSSQNPSVPKPGENKTASKPIPCSQQRQNLALRLKAQIDANAELSNKVEALERENASWHSLANEVTARELAAIDESEKRLRERDETIEKQRKLLEQYSVMSKALAAEMMSSDVSGDWTIQTARGPIVCWVQVYQATRTIQLTSCR